MVMEKAQVEGIEIVERILPALPIVPAKVESLIVSLPAVEAVPAAEALAAAAPAKCARSEVCSSEQAKNNTEAREHQPIAQAPGNIMIVRHYRSAAFVHTAATLTHIHMYVLVRFSVNHVSRHASLTARRAFCFFHGDFHQTSAEDIVQMPQVVFFLPLLTHQDVLSFGKEKTDRPSTISALEGRCSPCRPQNSILTVFSMTVLLATPAISAPLAETPADANPSLALGNLVPVSLTGALWPPPPPPPPPTPPTPPPLPPPPTPTPTSLLLPPRIEERTSAAALPPDNIGRPFRFEPSLDSRLRYARWFV